MEGRKEGGRKQDGRFECYNSSCFTALWNYGELCILTVGKLRRAEYSWR